MYQIKVTKKKINDKKISWVGKHWGSNQSNQNERGRDAIKTTQFMDRKPIRNRKKIRI